MGFLRRCQGNAIVLAHLPGQHRLPFLRPDAIRARRDARVRKIVAYAAATVPYYRDLFQRLQIDPRELRTAQDLQRLPLLQKQTVREAPERFVSVSPAGRTAVPFLTSGTTGEPLEVRHDLRSLLANIAFSEREREVVSRACGRATGYREASITYGSSTLRKVLKIYRERTLLPLRPERLSIAVEDPMEDVIRELNDFRPHVLVAYASYAETLFRTVAARGLPLHRPRVLVASAERMSDEGKRFIEERFGVPVHGRYNAIEAFKIGFTCEERSGFHLHEDLSVVRIVDRNGRSAAAGESGEVVISNLVNRGTVLLNYRLGDVAALCRTPCPCGRTLLRLVDLQGRVEEMIHLPGGRALHPRAVWGVFKGEDDVLRFQLVQREPARFELRVMTAERAGYDALIGGVLARLGRLLDGAEISASYAADLAVRRGEKFRPVVALPG